IGGGESTVAQAAQLPTDGAAQAAEEATGTIRGLLYGFLDNLPKYVIAAAVLVFAGLLVRVVRTVLRRVLRSWERSTAVTALSGVIIWLMAIGIATSILVGDIRALVGSLGLVGLALSWALQTPIESFTGWLLNSFHRYYRVGDRIAVGEVFGDVYRIDVLSTTVWEYGSSATTATNIHAEQPTGRLITFPNHEILTGSVVNYTRDFPYLWDELTVSVATEGRWPEGTWGHRRGGMKRSCGGKAWSRRCPPNRRSFWRSPTGVQISVCATWLKLARSGSGLPAWPCASPPN